MNKDQMSSRAEVDVTRLGDAGPQSDAEAHATGGDLEALGLDRVHVRHRDGTTGPQPEFEREQLAVGGRRRVGEGEALAGDRVLERLAGLDRHDQQ